MRKKLDTAVISLLTQKQIDDPAAADVFAGMEAVVEDVGVGATGFFQRVGEDRHVCEVAGVVHVLGH